MDATAAGVDPEREESADRADLSRRERRRLAIRERILETARSLFETRGYEATTVNEIAQRADIAYGTFFNHFPSKLDLLRDLSDRALRELFENVEEVRKRPGSVGDHVVFLFESSARKAEEMGPQMRELTGAMMTQVFPQTAGDDDLRMRRAFRRILEDGFAADEIQAGLDLDSVTEILVGTWSSIFRSWVHYDDYPLRERASRAAHILARTLTRDTPTGPRTDAGPPVTGPPVDAGQPGER